MSRMRTITPTGGPRGPVRRNAESEGFTLVELMLVIAIIVLLSGAGAGMYAGSYKKLLVEKSARQFLLMARYAKISAVEQQQVYDLEFDKDKGFLLSTTQPNEVTGQTEKTIIKNYYCRPVEFEGDVKFEDARFAEATAEPLGEEGPEQKISFLPNGTAQSVVVQIGDGKTHYTISIVASTARAILYWGPADKVTDVKNVAVDLDAQ